MKRFLAGLIAALYATAASAQLFPPPTAPGGSNNQVQINNSGAFGGVTALPNGITATTQANGDATLDLTTNQFVANAIAYVNPASAVNEATTGALPNTPTYANGTAGVGATLTAGANAALTIDGIAVALNDRVLVKNQATTFQNGCYTETQVGTGSVPWILTRCTDYNTPININYTGTIPVISGSTNALTNWLLVSTITTIGTDAITYTQQTTGGSTGGGGSGGVKCTPPLTKNQLLIGGGGNSCAVLGSSGASGQVLVSQGTSAPVFGNVAGVPQGRLTCTSGTPVMTADNAACTTIYYDCYAGIAIPYYNGTGDAADNITSCELSTAMQASSTGVINSSDVFDVWYVHSAATICIATNGSGGGWSSDSGGGSTTLRGTGYSQVHNTRGYWTNQNSITHCYNGSTDEGSISADQATYLGSLYTTSAGTTKMQFRPTPATGGTNNCLCLWNAYNQKPVTSTESDSTGNFTLTVAAGLTNLNASASNRVSWVDGLAQSPVSVQFSIYAAIGTSGGAEIALGLDNSNIYGYCFAQQYAGGLQIMAPCGVTPKLGFHYLQSLSQAAVATATFYAAGIDQEILFIAN